MNDSKAMIDLLRHSLSTIRYRADVSLQDAPEGFGEFELGSGTRTPVEIIAHICQVLTFTIKALDPETTLVPSSKSKTLDARIRQLNRCLHDADILFRDITDMKADTAKRLLQGPIADALTHVGQRAMLRRCAGAPIEGENLFEAEMLPINQDDA